MAHLDFLNVFEKIFAQKIKEKKYLKKHTYALMSAYAQMKTHTSALPNSKL